MKDILKAIQERADKVLADVVKDLANLGKDEATNNFSLARYTGKKDVVVTSEQKGNLEWEIIAKGESVAFIEFGTGIYFNGGGLSKNPLAKNVAPLPVMGSYGKHRGLRKSWLYYGTFGNDQFSKMITTKKGVTLVQTHGIMHQDCMYDASVVMRETSHELIEKNLKKHSI